MRTQPSLHSPTRGRLAACISLLAAACAADGAVNITTTASPDPFPAVPAPTEWSSLSVGAATDAAITSASQFDAKIIAAADAAVIATTLGSSGTTPPSASIIGRWNSGVNNGGITFLQTRPSGNDYILLMSTLVNATGGPLNQIKVAYDYSKDTVTATETIKGLRAYVSVTGAPGSWQPIPGLSVDTAGTAAAPQAISADVPLPSTVAAGGTVYLLWADQNSAGTDASYHIDNFAVTKSNLAILTPTISNVVRHPGVNPEDLSDDTVSFDVKVDVLNPSPGTPGWTTTGPFPAPAITGSYGTTYSIPNVPVSVIPITIGLADQTDPLSVSSLTLSSASLPNYAALNLISGSPQYVLTDTASAIPWNANGLSMSLTQTGGGGTVPYAASTTPITFSAGSPKFVSLTLEVQDNSTGSNFETEDVLKVELVTDAGTQLLTGLFDRNGSGFINGYTSGAPPLDYASNLFLDEFNRDFVGEADVFTNSWLLHGIIPAAATTAHILVTGLNNSSTETFRILDVRFGNAVDTDGDGAFDSEEAVAGTNPADPASVFRIVSQGIVDGVYLFTVPSTSTRLYQLQTSPDLVNWTPVSAPSFGTDGDLTLSSPADTLRKFARIVVY